MSWARFIDHAWPRLVRGERVEAPSFLGHPIYSGFRYLPIAQGEGQLRDWALSVADGSRIHVHELADGTLIAHRDRFDPQRGIVSAVRHAAAETRVGKLAAVGGVLYGATRIVGIFL